MGNMGREEFAIKAGISLFLKNYRILIFKRSCSKSFGSEVTMFSSAILILRII
jgi:hypothetical protein